MDLNQFKQLYERFNKPKLTDREINSPEYDAFVDAINNNKEAGDWYLAQQLEKRGFDYRNFCCIEMAAHIAEGYNEKGQELEDDPAAIIRKWDEDIYGIPVYDGQGAIIIIRFCPWCGTKLAKDQARG